MVRREDKLKNLFSWYRDNSIWAQEVNISWSISPIAKIKVVWVGWGWSNAVNRMIESWLEGVEFIVMNTDAQALFKSLAPTKLNIWKAITWWLWAWSDPIVWRKAAEESSEDIKNLLFWADMVFITCWLWGGTGTWAAPVVAEIAKQLGALTVWVVTKPFVFEWQNRMSKGIDGYNSLKEKVDTLITIPNERILWIIDKKTPLLEAFSMVDEILNQWVQWISDLITQTWLINVDFADVRSVMRNAGSALMWIWYGSWENRAIEAARRAIESPLLELSIAWAKWLLFNITWGTDLSMYEVEEAAKVVTESLDSDANIIFGSTIREDYEWEIKITVVATWFDESTNKKFSSDDLKIDSKSNNIPFWKKNIVDPKVNNINNINKSSNYEEDLDIPSFLRKKKI